VLQVAAFAGDRALYDQYVGQLAKLGAQPEEYYRFFNALSWFRDPALVKASLDFAVSPEVRTQDTGSLIAGLVARPWARDTAWAFTRGQWDRLVAKLGMFQGIPSIVSGLGNMCSAAHASDVKQFFTANPVPAATRGLQQSIERIENCAALDARQSPAMAKWVVATGQ
jgi:puromycin-sensitive aminopeptidase